MPEHRSIDPIDDPYSIPGGMICTVCGLRYYQQSMGGPGICPACDCGFTGATLVKAQKDEIERLQALMLKQTQLNTKMWQAGYDAAKRELTAPEMAGEPG